MVDAVLIFPPQSNPFYPYLSTPTLTSYLKEQGKTIIQRDINLELYDEMFTTDYFNFFTNSILEKINILDIKDNLNWKEQEELIQLICLRLAIDNLKSNYSLSPEDVKEAMRDINSYRYEDNQPVLLDHWNYFQKLNTIYTYHISPLQIAVCGTDSIKRAIEGEEYYFYYELLKNKFVPDILKDKPKLVGLSITYQTQVIPALYLGYLIKQVDPSVHLCIGGQHLSTISQDIHKFFKDIPFVDSIVVDEGEIALDKLIDYLNGNEKIENVPNLFYIKDGVVIENKRDVIKNVGDFPLPEFEGLPLDKYFTGSLVLPYAASKGCYYNKCTFCSFPFISPKYRIKEPSDVAKDLKTLSEKYNTKLFYLTNEADPPKRIKQLSEEIINLDLNIYYHSFCRFDRKVDKEMVELLAKSGCKVLFFGLESGSNRINEMMMNKGISYERAREILKYCDDYDISTVVSSIIAFPTETLEESIKTKEFLENYSYYRNHVPQSHDFRLPRGTDTELSHQKYGVTKLYRNEGNLSTLLSNYETSFPRLTQAERDKARIQHPTVGLWPHHDCLELQYAEYYKGNIPVVFSYNKPLEPPTNKKEKPRRIFTGYSYARNRYSFDDMIQRKSYRMDYINSLYRKGYFYQDIEKMIDESILGKEIKPYEISFSKDINEIKNLVDN